MSRVTALVVDLGVVTVAALAVGGLPPLVWQEVSRLAAPQWLTSATHAAAVVLPWFYFTSFWWITGQTVGDLVTGILVRRRDGRRVGLVRAALRAGVGLLLAPLWLVGLGWVLIDRRRRALHDLVFGTTVRYADATTPAPAGSRAD